MESFILQHTSTLGVRSYSVDRHILNRRNQIFETSLGKVNVKLATGENNQIIKIKPEFEDIKHIANTKNQSIQHINQLIVKEIYEQLNL